MTTRVALLNMPWTQPTAPPNGWATIVTHLRQSGIGVLPIDSSIEAYHSWLEPGKLFEKLHEGQEFLEERSKEPGLYQRIADNTTTLHDSIAGADLDRFRTLDAASLVEKVAEFWTDSGFEPSRARFSGQLQAFSDALVLSSFPRFPAYLAVPYCRFSPKFLRDYFMNDLIPRIEAYQPDLIGLSAIFDLQIVCAAYFIRCAHEAGLQTPIVIGGAAFTQLCCNVVGSAADCGCQQEVAQIDILAAKAKTGLPIVGLLPHLLAPIGLAGEGEKSLVELCGRIDRGEAFEGIEGGVFRSNDSNHEVLINPRPAVLDPDEIPLPDFAGLSLGTKYFSPYVTIQAMTSRGCYWKQCAFCNHSAIGMGFRPIAGSRLVQALKKYQDEYGVEVVLWCDEALPPKTLKYLAQELPKNDVALFMSTMIRAEKAHVPWLAPASAAGFRYLGFGFESGSDRIVKLMNKGHDQETAQKILEECKRAKVRVEALIMFGFPTETEAEASQTVDMLVRNADAVFGISLNVFALDPQSPVGRDNAAFGVIPATEGPITVDPNSYRTEHGITHERALQFLHQVKQHPLLSHKATGGHSRHEMRLVESLAENMESVDDLRRGWRNV